MKSGTSSLHGILAQHRDVFIPNGEIHFFCLDDIVQHPDFFLHGQEDLRSQDYDRDFERNLQWYRTFFDPARDEQWIGEDSTIYLTSRKAPSRIKHLLPDVKLIFILRNPVDRTYSHYWHRVRKGRAVHRFERELEHGSSTLFLRSFYAKPLTRYFDLFARDQIKVILLERFMEEPQRVTDEVTSFIGLPTSIDIRKVNTHSYSARVPLLHRVQLFLNYVEGGLRKRYRPQPSENEETGRVSLSRRILRRFFSGIRRSNLQRSTYPSMNPSTRAQLAHVFRRENAGLERLIGVEHLERYWPFWERK